MSKTLYLPKTNLRDSCNEEVAGYISLPCILEAYFKNLPVFANNTSALAGGLTAGTPYTTSEGVLMITK